MPQMQPQRNDKTQVKKFKEDLKTPDRANADVDASSKQRHPSQEDSLVLGLSSGGVRQPQVDPALVHPAQSGVEACSKQQWLVSSLDFQWLE